MSYIKVTTITSYRPTHGMATPHAHGSHSRQMDSMARAEHMTQNAERTAALEAALIHSDPHTRAEAILVCMLSHNTGDFDELALQAFEVAIDEYGTMTLATAITAAVAHAAPLTRIRALKALHTQITDSDVKVPRDYVHAAFARINIELQRAGDAPADALAATVTRPAISVSDLLRSTAAATAPPVSQCDPALQRVFDERDRLICTIEERITKRTSEELDDDEIRKHTFPEWKPGMSDDAGDSLYAQFQALRKKSHASLYNANIPIEELPKLFKQSREAVAKTLKIKFGAQHKIVDTFSRFQPETDSEGCESPPGLFGDCAAELNIDGPPNSTRPPSPQIAPRSPQMAPPSPHA
jgi:hypothetical protein